MPSNIFDIDNEVYFTNNKLPKIHTFKNKLSTIHDFEDQHNIPLFRDDIKQQF